VVEGLGTTIDLVLTDGIIKEGDTIVVCTFNGPVVRPRPILPIFFGKMYQLDGSRKSTSSQNRQVNISISNSQQ
jgi:translation initiation factor IF-2